MPLTFAAGDIAKVTVCCYTPYQIGLNIGYYVAQAPSAGAALNETEVADALDVIMAPKYKDILSAAAKYRGVRVQKILPYPAVSGGSTSVANDGVGAGGANLMPTQSCGIGSYKTAQTNRWTMGRHYYPFPSTTFADPDGSPTGAYLLLLKAVANGWSLPLNITSGANVQLFNFVIRSAPAPDASPPRPLSYPFVTHSVVPDKFATQRRRSQFGATNALPF